MGDGTVQVPVRVSDRGQDLGPGKDDFGVLLGMASSVFVAELRASMTAAGFENLGSWYGPVLRMLQPKPLSLRAMAELMEMSDPGALKVVNSMIKDGYLERGDIPEDRRVRQIRVTDKGMAALTAARRFHQDFERRLVDRLGERDVRATRRLLAAVIESGEFEAASAAVTARERYL